MTNAETDAAAGQAGRWAASWEAVRQAQLEAAPAATPEQRLAWLEDAMRLARASGAVSKRRVAAVRGPRPVVTWFPERP